MILHVFLQKSLHVGQGPHNVNLPLEPRSNDFASTGLPDLPSSVFVCVVIVCAIVRVFVRNVWVFVFAHVLVKI